MGSFTPAVQESLPQLKVCEHWSSDKLSSQSLFIFSGYSVVHCNQMPLYLKFATDMSTLSLSWKLLIFVHKCLCEMIFRQILFQIAICYATSWFSCGILLIQCVISSKWMTCWDAAFARSFSTLQLSLLALIIVSICKNINRSYVFI